ncbi:MAG: hypothetical protein DRH03_10555 [Deltaproteobacteria bacterium]|nr:MAG: hypothetical protein DRH03_10555 [Deltaproteobacteria bacterium]
MKKNLIKQIKTCNLNQKTAIPILIMILILGLALKSTLSPKPLQAQTRQCDHDHHATEPEKHHSEPDGHEHEGHDHAGHNHEQHDNNSHNPAAELHPKEHHDHDDSPECDQHNHDHETKADADHSDSESSCDLGHNHSACETHTEIIHMSPAEMKQFGIVVEKAVPGHIKLHTKARGQVLLNRDRMAQIVPRLSGTVKEIRSTLGDSVTQGEIMAIIESQELADAKTDYLNAVKHLELARTTFQREQKLRRKKINSEQEYLNARKDLAAAEISHTSSEQKLIFFGLSPAELKQLPSEPVTWLSRFIVRSPFSGDVIKKDVLLGQVLSGTTPIFTVADLTTVWVDLNLYSADANRVHRGNRVIISPPIPGEPTIATISYISPLVNPQTRTTKARVILDNPDGKLRPGSFITAEIITGEREAGIVVDKSILQDVAGRKCVFVQDDHGFESRPVVLGAANSDQVEIRNGIHPGELIVTQNSFRLKAALETGVGSGCSSSGHAH